MQDSDRMNNHSFERSSNAFASSLISASSLLTFPVHETDKQLLIAACLDTILNRMSPEFSKAVNIITPTSAPKLSIRLQGQSEAAK